MNQSSSSRVEKYYMIIILSVVGFDIIWILILKSGYKFFNVLLTLTNINQARDINGFIHSSAMISLGAIINAGFLLFVFRIPKMQTWILQTRALISPVDSLSKAIRTYNFYLGFIGWYLMNTLIWIWLYIAYDNRGGWNPAGGMAGYTTPINILLLAALGIQKKLRNIALGSLVAIAINAIFSMALYPQLFWGIFSQSYLDWFLGILLIIPSTPFFLIPILWF